MTALLRASPLLLLAATACGARTASDPVDEPVAPDAASGALGCPRQQPTTGSACRAEPGTDEVFGCYYFSVPTGEAVCGGSARAFFCEGSTFRSGCEGLFREDRCAAGKRCIFFGDEPGRSSAACVVECNRVCRCDPATETLECESLLCR